MRSSYNFGELISCFRVHMPPTCVYFQLSNGGSLLLDRTTVVGFGAFVESFSVGKYFKVLI